MTSSTLADIDAPSMPGDFRVTRMIDLWAKFEWRDAKDNIGVTGYELSRMSDGHVDFSEALKGKTFQDENVTPGASYRYQLVALDAAGNRSEAAGLEVAIPKDPPGEMIVELEKTDGRNGDGFSNKGWYAGDLHPGSWAVYLDQELGRTKPFTKATLYYGCDNPREGGKLEVILDPELSKNDKEAMVMTGGTVIGTFELKGTGGWESWKSQKIDVAIPKAGKHIIALRVDRADSKNAQCPRQCGSPRIQLRRIAASGQRCFG